MNILLIIRPEIFSILIMLFLVVYDRVCARYREHKSEFFIFAVVCLLHCIMALVTEITVNLDGIPMALNDFCHVLFFLFSLCYSMYFLEYIISQLFTRGRNWRAFQIAARGIVLICIVIMLVSPISYLQGDGTKYSAGIGPTLCFALGFLFFILADALLVYFHRRVDRIVLWTMLPLSVILCALLLTQILIPEFLFTAPALTFVTVGMFFVIENPVGKLQKQAFVDSALNIWNRNCYEHDLRHRIADMINNGERVIYVVGDVNSLKAVNDNLGHLAGDHLLVQMATLLRNNLRSAYKLYRIGGDEFAAIYLNATLETVEAEVAAAVKACGEVKVDASIPMGISVGYAAIDMGETFLGAAKRADDMMYDNKREFYRIHDRDRRRGY